MSNSLKRMLSTIFVKTFNLPFEKVPKDSEKYQGNKLMMPLQYNTTPGNEYLHYFYYYYKKMYTSLSLFIAVHKTVTNQLKPLVSALPSLFVYGDSAIYP